MHIRMMTGGGGGGRKRRSDCEEWGRGVCGRPQAERQDEETQGRAKAEVRGFFASVVRRQTLVFCSVSYIQDISVRTEEKKQAIIGLYESRQCELSCRLLLITFAKYVLL
jgi:hypothetical protein